MEMKHVLGFRKFQEDLTDLEAFGRFLGVSYVQAFTDGPRARSSEVRIVSRIE